MQPFELQILFLMTFRKNIKPGLYMLQKTGFFSIFQKILHNEKKYFAAYTFLPSLSKPVFHTDLFCLEDFEKFIRQTLESFCTVRENFCMLQKVYSPLLQPRKP